MYCVGEGPVLSISSALLDWGVIGVLENHTLPLCITNESDIPADFQCLLDKEVMIDSLQHELIAITT